MRTITQVLHTFAITAVIICANAYEASGWVQAKQRSVANSTEVRATLFEEADAAMQIAKEEDAAILAPKAFEAGLLSYQQAERRFQQGGKLEEIQAYLQEATRYFQQALSTAQWAGHTFTAALTAREDAHQAEAPTYAPDLWQQTEAKMKKAARTLEEGNLKSALKQAPAIEKQYRQAELAAIQNHRRPDMRSLSTSLEVQRENIAQLKQEIETSDTRVNSLEQQVTALERKLAGKNGTSTSHAAANHYGNGQAQAAAPRKVEIDAALQKFFAKHQAIVFRKDNDIVVRLFDLDFFANTGKLSASSTEQLWRVGEILKRFPHAEVTIAGHVLSERTREENLRLSRERAEAVKRYLIENRVVFQPVVAIGFGDTAPIPQEELAQGPIQNERIDVLIEFGPSQVSYLFQ